MVNQTGKIGWIDITVDDAIGLRDFYSDVVGLVPDAVSMGEYDDFNMTMVEGAEPVCGICHARGGNADLPGGWLVGAWRFLRRRAVSNSPCVACLPLSC